MTDLSGFLAFVQIIDAFLRSTICILTAKPGPHRQHNEEASLRQWVGFSHRPRSVACWHLANRCLKYTDESILPGGGTSAKTRGPCCSLKERFAS